MDSDLLTERRLGEHGWDWLLHAGRLAADLRRRRSVRICRRPRGRLPGNGCARLETGGSARRLTRAGASRRRT